MFQSQPVFQKADGQWKSFLNLAPWPRGCETSPLREPRAGGHCIALHYSDIPFDPVLCSRGARGKRNKKQKQKAL
jgi:hypothetical protein